MRKAISSMDLTESNLICAIDNLKQNLNLAQNGKLNQHVINQLTAIKISIEEIIKNQSNPPAEKDKSSPVNCQLCFQEQKDILQLQKHVKSSCQEINNPDIKETKKNSAFQILSSGFIKCKICNIFLNDFEAVLAHRQLEGHVTAKKKNNTHFSKLLYCSACGINVPDNVIQYENHIQNEIHMERCLDLKKFKGDDVPRNVLLKDGYQFLLRADNSTKCLLCNTEFEMSRNQLEIHKNSDFHVNGLKEAGGGQDCLKCLACDEKIVGLIPIILHLQSPGHASKAKAAKQTKPPVLNRSCLFCNANCKSIQKLASHQKEKCPRLVEKKPEVQKIIKAEDKNLVKAVAEKLSEDGKNEQWIFSCKICGFEKPSKNQFTDHVNSKGHVFQLKTIKEAGFEIFQDTCKVCKLDYIAPGTIHHIHAEHRGIEGQKKIRVRSKSLSNRKVVENDNAKEKNEKVKEKNEKVKEENKEVKEEKEKVPVKSGPTFPILLSGFSEVPSQKGLQKKLNLFGSIDSINVLPNKDVRVCFTDSASAEKVLSLKELSFFGSVVSVKKEAKEGGKKNVKSNAENKEKDSKITKPTDKNDKISIKPSLGDLYKRTEFDQKFLNNAKMILDTCFSLCKISDSRNNPEKNDEIGLICKQILNCTSHKIYGSYAYNLNMRDCSLDIFLTVPGLKIENNSEIGSAEKTLFQFFMNVLKNHSSFDNVREIDRSVSNFPYISCRKIDSNINCNISISNGLVIEKTEILKDQISIDSRIRPLLLLVKAWAVDKHLIDENKFSSYALFMMVIFFLQSDDIKILPKYKEMTNSPILHSFFKKQGSALGMTEFKTNNTTAVSQLFVQFLTFYTQFDYGQVICLPLCQCTQKLTLSNEAAFKDSAICVMDLLEPKVNLTKNVSESTLQEFLGYGAALLQNL